MHPGLLKLSGLYTPAWVLNGSRSYAESRILVDFGENFGRALTGPCDFSTNVVLNDSIAEHDYSIRMGNITILTDDFLVSETIGRVVVHHTDGLHMGITDGGTDKSKTSFEQIPAHLAGYFGLSRDFMPV